MKKALILIDIQNDYFESWANPLHEPLKASENAKKILEKFRQENMEIIHIKHISTRAWSTFFLPDTFWSEIHTNVSPLENEKVIIKNYPNSFRETELLNYLQEKNVEELVICWMMTHMCVDSTARAAKDFWFNITIIWDACATKSQEIFWKKVEAKEVQKSFLSALSYFYANIIDTKSYLLK